MTSIPQLHADINDLQKQLADARARIAELELLPIIVQEIKVPFETVRVEYRDRTVEVPIETVRVEYRDRTVEVPIETVRVEYLEKASEPTIVYVDNPELIDTITQLQSIIRARE